MFCHRSLGVNEVVEAFPVGRRLAFDARRGRLWVVCPKCERWNLSPLEERWEAVETCERLFRGTRLRASSDNVGLARHPEGLTLVRIGAPLRPEFAAWRYGDQFGRRRRRQAAYGAAAAVALGGIAIGGVAAGVFTGGAVASLPTWIHHAWLRRKVVKFPLEDGGIVKLRRLDVYYARLGPSEDDAGLRVQIRKSRRKSAWTWYEGVEGRRLAATILPQSNFMRGGRKAVRDAVGLIETAGSPDRLVAEAVRPKVSHKDGVDLGRMPGPTRLALEMALHEEQERRALEGELRLLERAWKRAEEIAAISDDLLLPDEARAFVARRGRSHGSPRPQER